MLDMDEVTVRNIIYQFDGYFTFTELWNRLHELNLPYEQKYVSKVMNEMIYWGNLKKHGIHYITVKHI